MTSVLGAELGKGRKYWEKPVNASDFILGQWGATEGSLQGAGGLTPVFWGLTLAGRV